MVLVGQVEDWYQIDQVEYRYNHYDQQCVDDNEEKKNDIIMEKHSYLVRFVEEDWIKIIVLGFEMKEEKGLYYGEDKKFLIVIDSYACCPNSADKWIPYVDG